MPSARKTQAICSRKIVMRSNGSRYSSEKIVNHHSNFSVYPFKELSSVLTARTIRSKMLSAVVLFQTTFTPSSETQGQSVWSGEGASEVQGRKQAPGYWPLTRPFPNGQANAGSKTFVAFSPDPTDCH